MKFINSTKDISDDAKVKTVFIDERGIETKNENNAAAKSTYLGSTTKFYVKSSKRQRRLFNPIVDKIDQRSVPRTELEFEFIEINKDCYTAYCEYLKNRNSYMLTKADIFAKR